MPEADADVFAALLKNPGQAYLNAENDKCYLLRHDRSGMIVLTGDFKGMTDAELNAAIVNYLKS
jgi:hypothetical protein